jgi:hypothetical protein
VVRFVVTVLAFALPFALFWLYTRVQARRRAAGARDPWPMAVLWMTGAVLAVEALALTAITAPPPGGVYSPARVEDGRVIPWRYEAPDSNETGRVPPPQDPAQETPP